MNPDFVLDPNCALFVGPLSNHFPKWLEQGLYTRILILTDENCRKYCLPYFLKQTGLPEQTPVFSFTPGESEKNLSTCAMVWKAMLDLQLDRKALVINLGGGVVGDLGGFCAATWKRGVHFVQIPTTLLSMTDAAIGGKTGIDFEGVKNSIGAFQQPAAVFADPFFLHTLSEREKRSGMAEVIKHALIGDHPLLNLLKDASLSTDALKRSIGVKVRVVAEDPYEKGLRMLLNYGHSIGHAIESWFMEETLPLTHGEAIAMGMVMESWAAQAQNLSLVMHLYQSFYRAVPIPKSAYPQLWQLLQQDKKNESGIVWMALPGEEPYQLRRIALEQKRFAETLDWWNNSALVKTI